MIAKIIEKHDDGFTVRFTSESPLESVLSSMVTMTEAPTVLTTQTYGNHTLTIGGFNVPVVQHMQKEHPAATTLAGMAAAPSPLSGGGLLKTLLGGK